MINPEVMLMNNPAIMEEKLLSFVFKYLALHSWVVNQRETTILTTLERLLGTKNMHKPGHITKKLNKFKHLFI